MQELLSEQEVKRKFVFLHMVATALVGMGVVLVVGAVLLAVITIIETANNPNAPSGVVVVFGVGGFAVGFYLFVCGVIVAAYGQFLQVVLQIEDNTQ